MLPIDINCDMGESWHDRIIGQDEALMPHISSCNLACGVHGGDPITMDNAIQLAKEHNVKIGAHPSLPKLENFGRVSIDLPLNDLRDLVFSQIERLGDLVTSNGQHLHHIKPHGALYHLAAQRDKEADIIVAAALTFGIKNIYGLPDSLLHQKTIAAGLTFWKEGFIDRAYENGQQLRPRKLEGAVHKTANKAAHQAYELAIEQQITDYYGHQHPLIADTLCIHGDHDNALETLLAVQDILAS